VEDPDEPPVTAPPTTPAIDLRAIMRGRFGK